MEEYEEGIYYLLELGDGWSTEDSGISPPGCLANISYLRQEDHRKTLLKVDSTLRGFHRLRNIS
jgi:hypothetical protein